jgi:hypothetical protein
MWLRPHESGLGTRQGGFSPVASSFSSALGKRNTPPPTLSLVKLLIEVEHTKCTSVLLTVQWTAQENPSRNQRIRCAVHAPRQPLWCSSPLLPSPLSWAILNVTWWSHRAGTGLHLTSSVPLVCGIAGQCPWFCLFVHKTWTTYDLWPVGVIPNCGHLNGAQWGQL